MIAPSELATDIPHPVLFNPWKHHVGVLRHRIAEFGWLGPEALRTFPDQLLVLGTELMDLYTGILSPVQIGEAVMDRLQSLGFLAAESYRAWIESQGGYAVIDLTEDTSHWVLRWGEEHGRYVHLHPGRWTPHTRRVRANVLRTAAMVLAYTAVHGGDPNDRQVINRVRQEFLRLPPIGKLVAEGGLPEVIELVRG